MHGTNSSQSQCHHYYHFYYSMYEMTYARPMSRYNQKVFIPAIRHSYFYISKRFDKRFHMQHQLLCFLSFYLSLCCVALTMWNGILDNATMHASNQLPSSSSSSSLRLAIASTWWAMGRYFHIDTYIYAFHYVLLFSLSFSYSLPLL